MYLLSIVDFVPSRVYIAVQEQMCAIDDSSKGPSGVLEVPKRYLMGPGPANADPRVLNAQALPLLGHMYVKIGIYHAFMLNPNISLVLNPGILHS